MKHDLKFVGPLTSIIVGCCASVDDAEACLELCQAESTCLVWNLKTDKKCQLLSSFTDTETSDGYVAGGRNVCIGDV